MWSLDKIHKVGELAAAVAVVTSLIFVGLQIRDNTIASEAATYQASVAYDIELLSNVAGNADLARIFYAYAWEPSDNLDGTELLQAQWHFTAVLRHLENLYFQHQSGMLSEASWESRSALMRATIQNPGFEKFLRGVTVRSFSGEFIDYAREIRAAPKIENGN